MSQPFAMLVAQRVKQFTDQELADRSFELFNQWAMQSTDKQVSLDQVGWIGAFLVKAAKSAGIDLLAKHETRDENGARVVSIVATDGVAVADGAG